MNNSNYMENVLKTESFDEVAVLERLNKVSTHLQDLLYAHSKLVKDIDDVKKYIYYGKNSVSNSKYNSGKSKMVVNLDQLRLLHTTLGMITESNEVSELVETLVYDNEKLDDERKAYLIQEIGDITWYIAVALNVLNVDFSTVFAANIKKLLDKKNGRYKSGVFNSNEAINKSIDTEMQGIKELLSK